MTPFSGSASSGKLSLIFILTLMSLIPPDTSAQFTLPKAEVLARSGARVLHVTQTPLRMVDRNGKDVTPQDFKRETIKFYSYYFNSRGQIDSLFYYPTETGYYQKHVLRYDVEGRLVENHLLDGEGNVVTRSLLERQPKGTWHYREWKHGELFLESKSTSNGIVLESTTHRGHQPHRNYNTYHFDLGKNTRTDAWYIDEKLISKESWQWIAEHGRPKQFIYSVYKQEIDKDNTEGRTFEYELDEKGNVVNELSGQVFDPFRGYNYFKRYRYFEGIKGPHQDLFTENALETEQEVSILHTFDGTDIVYRYDFVYE